MEKVEESFFKLIAVTDTEGGQEKFIGALTILEKLLSNLLHHPTEEKYRSLRVSNPALARKLFSLDGSRELLQAVGFQSVNQDDGEHLILLQMDETLLGMAHAMISTNLQSANHLVHPPLSDAPAASQPNRTPAAPAPSQPTPQDDEAAKRLAESHERVKRMKEQKRKEKERIHAQFEADRKERASRKIETSSHAQLKGYGARIEKFEPPRSS